jgi:hypothetical protein
MYDFPSIPFVILISFPLVGPIIQNHKISSHTLNTPPSVILTLVPLHSNKTNRQINFLHTVFVSIMGHGSHIMESFCY